MSPLLALPVPRDPGPGNPEHARAAEPGGWTDLLADAGEDLKGWTRGPIPPGGKLGEKSQWSIDPGTGHLACEGTGGHEWLRFDKELGDFVYHIEWRFSPGEKKGYNSGIYVRSSADAKVWHQVQTGGGSGGYLFGETMAGGKLKPFNLSKQVRDRRVKPAGRVERCSRSPARGRTSPRLG